jgi:hypothetical protein
MSTHQPRPLTANQVMTPDRPTPGLKRMMDLERGPGASRHVAVPGRTVRRVGSNATGFKENDDTTRDWALPNALGVVAP